MITISLDPTLVHVGPFALTWYGLAVALGLAVAIRLTLREARRKGLDAGAVADLVVWVVLGGVAGARLLHVIDRWPDYATNPPAILAIQNGGLAIQGAILGGALTGGALAWRRSLPVRRLSDAAAPGVVLGQAIGRFGCLVTGDALGPVTGGTWGIVYTHPAAMAPQLGVAYQPTFLYEQLWDVAIFALLWTLRGRLTRDGQLFGLYLGMYAAGKFALTFLRTEAIWLFGLQQAQVVALAGVAAALAWALWGRGTRAGTAPQAA